MIVKGRARSGGAQLAAYLMRQTENPTLVELFDGSDDLKAAFLQWDAIGELTRGDKALYHAQIAPQDGYAMSPDQGKRVKNVRVGWWHKNADSLKASWDELQRTKLGRRARVAGMAEHVVEPKPSIERHERNHRKALVKAAS